MIENPATGRVRRAAQLHRKKDRFAQGRFLVEGPHAVAEAMKHAANDVEVVFATQQGLTRSPELDRLADTFGVIIELVTDEVLTAIADTVTPQGIVAVVKLAETTLESVQHDLKLVAVLHEVRDPGNAGTVIRGADAAGADLVILTGDSVDPWHPKVVRASTGSLFHVPVVRHHSLSDALDFLHRCNIVSVATDLSGEDIDVTDSLLRRRIAWVFGNEAHGLSPSDMQLCQQRKRLPIFGHAESLNLATAATVCLYTTAFAQRA
ncbi:MAG: TrmH family RNA methyltransferase [Canibacter sp.]